MMMMMMIVVVDHSDGSDDDDDGGVLVCDMCHDVCSCSSLSVQQQKRSENGLFAFFCLDG